MYETVMSHPSKIAELQQAKAAGYHVTIHLQTCRLAFTVDTPARWVHRLASCVNERAAEAQAFVDSAASHGLPLRFARFGDDVTQGPIVIIGRHLVWQHDEITRSSVLHERVLLGAQVDRLAVQHRTRLAYREGVVSIEPSFSDSGRDGS